MNSDRLMKDAIDFEELRKQKASFESDIRVHTKLIEKNQQGSLSLRSSEEAKKRIPEIDALLAKEPPSPELPPRSPLIKVSGVLEEIDILFARGYFTDREYEPEEFARKERSNQWGSVLLAAIGESAAAAVNSQDSIRPVRKYDFVKGKINGKCFYGWLGRVTAQPGDFIELVAIEKNDIYEVYALTIPELRVVSLMPECYQGIKSRRNSEVKSVFVIYVIVSLLFLIGIIAKGDGIDDIIEMLSHFYILLVVNAAMCIPLAIWTFYKTSKKPKPTVIMTQRLFTILEIPNPEMMNIVKYTKKIAREKRGTESGNRVMPDKRCIADYYYYY